MKYIRYFAYGSNMHEEDLRRWCLERNYSPVNYIKKEVAVLKDWKLVFNYYSASRGGGAANIIPSKGDMVWGLLVEVSEEDYQKIYKKEGAPKYYKEIIVTVETRDGKIVDNVRTFKVVEDKESDKYVPPTKEYLRLLIEAARKHEFPEWYVKRLESLPTK